MTEPTMAPAEAFPEMADTVMEEEEGMSASSEPDEPQEEVASEPTITEQRRVHAQLRQANQRRSTFLAGADNTIRCWIGLPDTSSAAVAPSAIPEVSIPKPRTAADCRTLLGRSE